MDIPPLTMDFPEAPAIPYPEADEAEDVFGASPRILTSFAATVNPCCDG